MTRFLQVVHLGRPLDVLKVDVLILSLEQHVAEEVEDALPPVVRLEHLDELLARQLIQVLARTTTCRSRRMLVRSRHSMEISQLSVPKNSDE